jgi:hypothetical protein
MQTPVTRSVVAANGLHETAGTTVTDASGHNSTGTLSSGLTRRMQGTFGSALVFNGSCLETIPATAALHLMTTRTLEAWVSLTATPTNWSTVLMQEPPDTLVHTLYAGSPVHRPNVYVNPAPSSSREHAFADSRPYL